MKNALIHSLYVKHLLTQENLKSQVQETNNIQKW